MVYNTETNRNRRRRRHIKKEHTHTQIANALMKLGFFSLRAICVLLHTTRAHTLIKSTKQIFFFN